MRTSSVAIMVLTAGLAITVSNGTLAADAPLPEDVKIVRPAEDVPDSLRRFSGVWKGKWAGEMDHVLVVEAVLASGKASIVYAWGDSSRWKITRGWTRTTATISGDKIDVDRFRNGAEVTYKLEGADALSGDYWRSGHLTEGTFTRTTLPLPQ